MQGITTARGAAYPILAVIDRVSIFYPGYLIISRRYPSSSFFFVFLYIYLGGVVQRPISANPGLAVNLLFCFHTF